MILITGHKGFIGSHFFQTLKTKNESPILGVEQEESWEFLNSFQDWDRLSLIIHNGAISSTTEKNLALILKQNVNFTLKLFEKGIHHQIPIKYASSASVYGHQTEEEKSIGPLNQYAISKLQIDYYVQDHLNLFKSIQGFRYFNVYGTGEEHKLKVNQASPISKFTHQIRDTGKIKLFENSHQFLRDFVCVNDVVKIVLNNNAPSGIYDIGTGSPISFQEVGELIAEKEKGKIEFIPFPDHLKGKYQSYTCADNSWYSHQYLTVKEYLSQQ